MLDKVNKSFFKIFLQQSMCEVSSCILHADSYFHYFIIIMCICVSWQISKLQLIWKTQQGNLQCLWELLLLQLACSKPNRVLICLHKGSWGWSGKNFSSKTIHHDHWWFRWVHKGGYWENLLNRLVMIIDNWGHRDGCGVKLFKESSWSSLDQFQREGEETNLWTGGGGWEFWDSCSTSLLKTTSGTLPADM